MKIGVNFFGPYETRDSIGRVAALNIECLKMAKIPHEIYLLPRPGPSQSVDYGILDDSLFNSLKYKINIFNFNARRAPLYFSRLGENSLNGFYNIGLWVHEMKTIPLQWARQLRYFNEIWAPSSICHEAISRYSNIPVVKIPYPIVSMDLTQRIVARNKGINFPEFTFLTIFDVVSDAERKNPLFAIRAYLNMSECYKSSKLIVKVRNTDHDPLLAEKLLEISKKNNRVEVINCYFDEKSINKLYERVDTYISFHRAEGFGLTISDSISRGIPVIVTGYSGNMDFCDPSDTRLVSYDLIQVGHNRPRYRFNDLWAEPNMNDAVSALEDMVKNYPLWLQKALHARERVQRDFSIEKVGDLMRERIELISNNFMYHDDMSERKIDYNFGISKTYGF